MHKFNLSSLYGAISQGQSPSFRVLGVASRVINVWKHCTLPGHLLRMRGISSRHDLQRSYTELWKSLLTLLNQHLRRSGTPLTNCSAHRSLQKKTHPMETVCFLRNIVRNTLLPFIIWYVKNHIEIHCIGIRGKRLYCNCTAIRDKRNTVSTDGCRRRGTKGRNSKNHCASPMSTH